MEIELLKSGTELQEATETFLRLNRTRDPEAISSYQHQRLEAVWHHAKKTIHYKDLPPFSMSRFLNLPAVPKEALKNNPSHFDAVGWNDVLKYYESSGTTGVATPTLRTASDIVWNYASVWLNWGEIIESSDRCLILLPSDVSPIGDLIAGVCALCDATTMRCFPFAQGIVSWDRIQSLSDRYRPTTIWSSPGTATQLLRILKRRGMFSSFAASVRKIMLLGEVVSPQLMRRLATEWNALVYAASYGSTETGTIAATGRTNALRLLDYSFICELKTTEGIIPARPGCSGELVITTLNAVARPLIRYCTGDLVRLSPHGAWTGVSVLGRNQEQVRICGRPLSIMDVEELVYGVEGVTAYQLLASGDEVTSIRLECDPEYATRHEQLRASARDSMQRCGIAVDLAIVDELPLSTKSGAGLKNWKRANVVTN